ncbi:MAG: hypothetical protein C0606_06025 [Hyphomicrobiales bacterium]|nr:MAG: hypothetical protein C0606_06025 [Hyphomicrobiales bacterium]
MIRKLLTTTAIATMILTGAAVAEDKTAEGTETTVHTVTVFTIDPNWKAPSYHMNGYVRTADSQILASSLLGKTVYSGKGADMSEIGDVNDIVMSENGMADAIVVGVGGFLGIGEKDVAVAFERVNWVRHEDEMILSINATKEDLESAPEFDRATVMKKVSTSEPMMTKTDMAATEETMEKSGTDVTKTDERVTATDDKVTDVRDGMKIVNRDTLSAENLIGTRVYGQNDKDIGEIGDVIVSTTGDVEAYIVDVGGFLGIGEKPIALDASQLDIFKDVDGDMSIYTPYTQAQLETYTAYSEEAYKSNRDAVLVR